MKTPEKPDNYIPTPADTTGIELPEELVQLREQIAENVHEVWAQGRVREGWTWAPGPKDPEKKTTPLLVPYDQLPESERDYDRNTAEETLKPLLKWGWHITKD